MIRIRGTFLGLVSLLSACGLPVSPQTLYGTWRRDDVEPAHVRIYEVVDGRDMLHVLWVRDEGTIANRSVGTFEVQSDGFVAVDPIWTSAGLMPPTGAMDADIKTMKSDRFVLNGGGTYVRETDAEYEILDTGEPE